MLSDHVLLVLLSEEACDITCHKVKFPGKLEKIKLPLSPAIKIALRDVQTVNQMKPLQNDFYYWKHVTSIGLLLQKTAVFSTHGWEESDRLVSVRVCVCVCIFPPII